LVPVVSVSLVNHKTVIQAAIHHLVTELLRLLLEARPPLLVALTAVLEQVQEEHLAEIMMAAVAVADVPEDIL
jgi:hypothetical protein